MKFADFNAILNHNDSPCYKVVTNGNSIHNVSFKEIKSMLTLESAIYMEIPKGIIILRTKEKLFVEMLKAKNEKCLIVNDGEFYNIYFKSSFNKSVSSVVLACGLGVDVLRSTARKSPEILVPFRNPRNTNPVYNDYIVEHDNSIGNMPLYCTPIAAKSNSFNGLDFPIVDNVPTVLLNHSLRLKTFKQEDKLSIISDMNSFLCSNPITIDELRQVISCGQTALMDRFFDKNTFLHYEFGNYLIEACNIKRDKITKGLYYYDYKHNVYVNDDAYLLGFMTKQCPRLKDHQKDETLKYIKNYLYDDAVEFNKSDTTIVFKNGILDIADGSFEPMDVSKLESVQINVNYNPDAYSAVADEFFKTATGGDVDCEKILLEAIGYTLLKTTKLQKSFILLGSGRNGKSTFLDVIKNILGAGNYASVSMRDLSNNFRLSELENKLASIAADISSAPIQETDLLKSIICGEDVMSERKYEQAKTTKFFATMLYACNKLPRTTDTSNGFYRRWVIVPFNANLEKVSSVEGSDFSKRLLAQESLDYIAYRAVQAISVVMNTTLEFTQPLAAKQALEDYIADNSSTLCWINEEYPDGVGERGVTMMAPLKKYGLTDAYDKYKSWCQDSSRKHVSKQTFRKEIASKYNLELKQ